MNVSSDAHLLLHPAGIRRAPRPGIRWRPALLALGLVALAASAFATGLPAQQQSHPGDPDDPRIGLEAGWLDAGEAAWNMELVASLPRPEGFYQPGALGNLNYANSDIAFRDDLVFLGSFHGFQIFDVSDPTAPVLRVAVVCPGGQGDVSIYGDLLFMSVEQTRGRIDCGTEGTSGEVDPERFRGVRIFDVSDIDNPTQIAAVQTCRGSHTHTLLKDPNDDENVYVYVSGTSSVRPAEELAGCSDLPPEEDPETSFFRIEVIRVPLSAPQDAAIVSGPRLFADEETGEVAGLWAGGDHGDGTQVSRETNQCHDITTYPELGIAAGACSGNGILLDISDPANPVRIDEVVDPNFAYWHSAMFNNDGTKVVFTDEWGGWHEPTMPGRRPARVGRQRHLRHRRRPTRAPQLLQASGPPDGRGELRRAQRLPRACSRP